MRAEQLTDPIVDHGEGPVYSPRWDGVRWVDMLAGDILELGPDGSVARQHVGSVAAMIRPRRDGGLVIAGERCLLLTDDDRLDAPVRALPEVWSDSTVRMNDGGCDPAGNLYVGSMAYDAHPGGGKLYCVRPDGSPHVILTSVTISNGLDWSPDGSLAYYVDTPNERVDVFDWSPETDLSHRRPFVTVEGTGAPDGLTVDADGGVWVALFGGSAVHRYAPAGLLDEVVELPVSQVTAVTFAGVERDQLIITTSRQSRGDDAELAAGALFRATPGVRGLPVRPYAG